MVRQAGAGSGAPALLQVTWLLGACRALLLLKLVMCFLCARARVGGWEGEGGGEGYVMTPLQLPCYSLLRLL